MKTKQLLAGKKKKKTTHAFLQVQLNKSYLKAGELFTVALKKTITFSVILVHHRTGVYIHKKLGFESIAVHIRMQHSSNPNRTMAYYSQESQASNIHIPF